MAEQTEGERIAAEFMNGATSMAQVIASIDKAIAAAREEGIREQDARTANLLARLQAAEEMYALLNRARGLLIDRKLSGTSTEQELMHLLAMNAFVDKRIASAKEADCTDWAARLQAAEQRAERAEAESAKYRGAARLVQESAAIGEEDLRKQLQAAEEKAAALEEELHTERRNSAWEADRAQKALDALAAIQAACAKEPS